MSDVEDAISYVFVWHSLSDACPTCQRLNGREYEDQDLFQNTLWDMFEGDIWDLNADRSLMHGGSGTCRCQLEVRVEVTLTELEEYERFRTLIGRFM